MALLLVVVGSGIMRERLAAGNTAVALLANALATGAGLFVLISIFGPLSGAHFNPVVSTYARIRGELTYTASFAGIAPHSVAGFLGGQALALVGFLALEMAIFSDRIKEDLS
jgi:glycerol uptake facilitator-like aquaporin